MRRVFFRAKRSLKTALAICFHITFYAAAAVYTKANNKDECALVRINITRQVMCAPDKMEIYGKEEEESSARIQRDYVGVRICAKRARARARVFHYTNTRVPINLMTRQRRADLFTHNTH